MSEDFSSLAAVIKPLSSEDAYGEAFHQVGLVHEKSANVMKDIVRFILFILPFFSF